MNSDKTLVDQLAVSEFFRDYEKAFSTATGMPVALRAVETFDLPFHGKKQENAFCAMMAKENRACGACLQMQEDLRRSAAEKPATEVCAHGVCEAAVPVRLGDKLIAFLQTGQVIAEKPTAARLAKVVSKARGMGIEESPDAIQGAYLSTPVVPRAKLNAILRLLTVFADLLAVRSNQLTVSQANSEHPVVTKAKLYIEQQHAEEISLGQVAQAVHVSPFHLCKLFRKTAGITFTEFVSRVRTEKAKSLLLNPQLRISEIVYDVGFQSLSHFNRIFKKLVGESPTRYRERTIGCRPASDLPNCLRPRENAKVLASFA